MGLNNIGCDLIRGIELPKCHSGGYFGMGGIKQLYLVKALWVDSSGYLFDPNDKITAITMLSAQKFKQIELQFETAQPIEKEIYAERTGAYSFQSTIQFLVYKQHALNRKLLLELINAQQLIALYQDNNGRWFLAGKDNYLRAQIDSITPGKSFTDFNGYNVTLLGSEKFPFYEVDASVIPGIIETNFTEDCCLFRDSLLYLIQNYDLWDYRLCNVSIC